MEDRNFLEKDRIPVFIGTDGSIKKQLEAKFNSKLTINSQTGEVIIESDDALANFIISNMVNAVNYGHNPLNAMKLEDENYVMDTIDIKNYVKDSQRLKVVMGRIIGKEGSTRRIIEEVTRCSVSVKDHFVSVIGPYENILVVHEAIEMLINGAAHKSFYAFLERNRSKIDTGLL